MRINKWLDLIDRVGWTAVQVSAGAGAAALFAGMDWRAALTSIGTAVAIAVVKVVTAQNTGSNDLGAAVPGEVIEPKPVA